MMRTLVGLLLAGTLLTGCRENAPAEPAATEPAPASDSTLAPLGVEDLTVGTGMAAQNGDLITVHYTGKMTDGTVFESSLRSGQPLQFQLGAAQVIAGWDQGLLGMKVGGKRTLTIPPHLGYGAMGSGPIPPNATLVFDVDLIDVARR